MTTTATETCSPHSVGMCGKPFDAALQFEADWLNHARWCVGPAGDRQCFLYGWARHHSTECVHAAAQAHHLNVPEVTWVRRADGELGRVTEVPGLTLEPGTVWVLWGFRALVDMGARREHTDDLTLVGVTCGQRPF